MIMLSDVVETNEMENKRLLNLYAGEIFRPITPLSLPFIPYSTNSSAGGKRRGKSHKHGKKYSKMQSNRNKKH